ncbi:hypothetical protein Aperf_G00000014155 [Anoplocephala perfoliata]
MDPNVFEATKILGRGKFTVTYEAIRKQDKDKDKKYALKRFFLIEPGAVSRVLRERRIFERLMSDSETSPFVITLLYAIGGWKTPSFILPKASDYDLYDLRKCKGVMREEEARFYIAEVICALEYLHSRNIVHLDIRPGNILLNETGHIILTDFDLSYDLEDSSISKKEDIFRGTYEYMAPEIANDIEITTKADVWSLGALMAQLVSPQFRVNFEDNTIKLKIMKLGKYEIPNLKTFSSGLQTFLQTCLVVDYKTRPEIAELKGLEFFKMLNWIEVATDCMQPPFKISDLVVSRVNKFRLNPTLPDLLLTAFGPNMPVIEYLKSSEQRLDSTGFEIILPNNEKLKAVGYTVDNIRVLFKEFDFTNPLLQGGSSEQTS